MIYLERALLAEMLSFQKVKSNLRGIETKRYAFLHVHLGAWN